MTHGANKAKVHLLGAFGRICLTRKSWMPQRLTLKSVLLPCIHNEAMVLMSYRCGWVRILLCHLGFVLLGSSLEHLRNNPDLVGQSVCDTYGPDIPFLPKVKDRGNLIKTTLALTMTRCSPLLKRFHFQFIQTKPLLSIYTRGTPRNSATPTTSPRSPSHCLDLNYLWDSNHSMKLQSSCG